MSLKSSMQVFAYPGRIDFVDTGINFWTTAQGEDHPQYINSKFEIAQKMDEVKGLRTFIERNPNNQPGAVARFNVGAIEREILTLRSTFPDISQKETIPSEKKKKKLKPTPYHADALPNPEDAHEHKPE